MPWPPSLTISSHGWSVAISCPVPKLWQHDILRKDGTPFDEKEIELIRKMMANKKPAQS
jgi:hypothetical protein